MAVIPTDRKQKLPARLSYPLGAKEVSEALAGVPQFDRFALSFHGRPMHSAVEFDAVLRAGAPHLVFRAAFHKREPFLSSPNLFVESGWYDPQWELTVYPVPRQHRHAANVALTKQALPKVKQWLSQPGAQAWRSGYKALEFLFSPKDGSLSCHEQGEVLC